MKYNPERHNRHSIRLHGYDYATVGAYFVTICLNQRIFFPHAGATQRGCPLRTQICPFATNVRPPQTQICHFPTNVCPREPKSAKMQTNTHIANLNAGQQRQPQGQTRRSAPTGSVTMNHGFDFPTFGVVENGVMVLNDCGKMIEKYILEIVNNTDKFSNIKIDEYIVMPDHIHAIIIIEPPNHVGADLCVCPCTLGTIIQWFKTMTTNEYTTNVKTTNWRPFHKKLWQRNYYESIIRDEDGYARIAKYIRNNPISWGKKHLNDIFYITPNGNLPVL